MTFTNYFKSHRYRVSGKQQKELAILNESTMTVASWSYTNSSKIFDLKTMEKKKTDARSGPPHDEWTRLGRREEPRQARGRAERLGHGVHLGPCASGWNGCGVPLGKLNRALSRLYQNQNQKSFGFRKEKKPRCVRETKSSPNPSRQVLYSTISKPNFASK